MRGAVPDLEVHLSRGDLGAATSWLRSQVQVHGGRFAPAEVIGRACGGAEPTAGPLLDYLEEKFGGLGGGRFLPVAAIGSKHPRDTRPSGRRASLGRPPARRFGCILRIA